MRLRPHGQTPRWRLMWVTSGRMGGQLDVVVGVDVGLVGGAECVGAMRAGGKRCLDDAIGVLGQRAGHTEATEAGR